MQFDAHKVHFSKNDVDTRAAVQQFANKFFVQHNFDAILNIYGANCDVASIEF